MTTQEATQTNAPCSVRIAQSSLFLLVRDRQRRLCLRLQERLCHEPEIVDTFRHLDEGTANTASARILKLDSYHEDADGGYWLLADENVLSLNAFLRQKPNALSDEPWKEQIVSQLISCVEFLQKRSALELELNLQSVLVTTLGGHNVRLLPPCHSFLPFKDVIWRNAADHLAPELTGSDIVTSRADIYAVGYLIKALYPTGGLPFALARTVEGALAHDPEKRFRTAGDMNRFMEARRKTARLRSYAATSGIVVALLAIFAWALLSDDPQQQMPDYQENSSDMYADSLSSEERFMDEVRSCLNDTTQTAFEEYEDYDTTDTYSPTSHMRQRPGFQKDLEEFKAEFTMQATPIIKRNYDSKLMDGDKDAYQQNAQRLSLQIQQLQTTLAEKHQIDPTTANTACSAIVKRISEKCLKN